MPNIIEVNHLVKYYPGSDQPAVRDLSFAIRRGEIFGFLGPDGAGKTTIISLLSGLLKPTSGNAILAGFDLVSQPHEIKHRCKFVPQTPTLIPLLSIQDNLLLYGRLHGIKNQQLRPRVAEALQLVGLDAGRRDRVTKQSSGTQRRISLAAALLHQPEVLLFDEPTLNVNEVSRDGLLQSVVELNRRGLTVVYATRDAAEAARLCHRVALIDQGRIVALDTPHALQNMPGGGLPALESLDAVFVELTGKHLRG
ncbi:Linearmycin resistance ATP-binding protein LnrL [Thermoflexales bacterium]|nr:Linearmycin resistance ATP-binding protein LnrL [Thermoflexales bacterium]